MILSNDDFPFLMVSRPKLTNRIGGQIDVGYGGAAIKASSPLVHERAVAKPTESHVKRYFR